MKIKNSILALLFLSALGASALPHAQADGASIIREIAVKGSIDGKKMWWVLGFEDSAETTKDILKSTFQRRT